MSISAEAYAAAGLAAMNRYTAYYSALAHNATAAKMEAAEAERYVRAPAPKPAHTGKCPCCGSRSFATRNDMRVCIYCRSEQ